MQAPIRVLLQSGKWSALCDAIIAAHTCSPHPASVRLSKSLKSYGSTFTVMLPIREGLTESGLFPGRLGTGFASTTLPGVDYDDSCDSGRKRDPHRWHDG